MLRKLRNLLPLIIAALLLAAVGYWNIVPHQFLDQPVTDTEENPIDFFVENARSQQFHADGTLRYEMTSVRLDHLKISDITLLEKPDLLLYRDGELPWHVRSERGEVSSQGTEVELIDNVRTERTDAKGRHTLLTTSRMTVFPEREYAETQQAVRIEAANGVTTGQGMKAYLNEGRMLLLSNVRGQHEVR